MEFEFPNADLSRVYEDTATLVFTPPSGSTVTINGENVTNKTDESGTVRYSIPVQMGDNTVSLSLIHIWRRASPSPARIPDFPWR